MGDESTASGSPTLEGDLTARLVDGTDWRLGWAPQLDGLRALATFGVMTIHFLSSFGDLAEGLSISVDLFFAMSGFLITTLLFAEADKRGAVSIKRFYIRRVLRLLPALLVLLAVFTLFAIVAGGDERAHFLTEAAAVLFYVYNFFVAWMGVDGQALIQLWTLSIEQQFYLLWPPIMAFMVLKRRDRTPSPKRVMVLIAAMVTFIIVLPALRMSLPHDLGAHTGTSFLFGLTIMRPDAVVLGCLAAMAMRVWPADGDRRDGGRERRLSSLGTTALVVIVLVCVSGPIIEALADRSAAVARIEWLFVPRYVSPLYNLGVVAAAVFVFDLIRNPDKRIARLLRTRPLVWIGERSYAMYIWHLLIYFVLKGVLTGMLPGRTRMVDIVALPFGYALTILVAMASWRFIEAPALRLKARFGA